MAKKGAKGGKSGAAPAHKQMSAHSGAGLEPGREAKSSGAAAAASGAFTRVAGALRAVYLHLPKVPFLDRQTSAILYACIAAYLLLMVSFSAATPPLQTDVNYTIQEGVLHKNADLAILPGENYSYVLNGDDGTMGVTYFVRRMEGCQGVAFYDNQSGDPPACLLQSGNLDSDAQMHNSTFGTDSELLFLPWMLAVSGNFSWSVSSDYWNGYFNMHTGTNFTSLGKSSALGRDAYLIRAQSDAYALPSDYYIDSEKRVLLYIKSGNTSAWLAEAPFAIDASKIPTN